MKSWEKNKAADIRGAGYGLKGFRGPDLYQAECPECHKARMLRPLGHQVSFLKEEIEINGIVRQVYRDVCQVCQDRLLAEIKKSELNKAKKAQRALREGKNLDSGISLEDAL